MSSNGPRPDDRQPTRSRSAGTLDEEERRAVRQAGAKLRRLREIHHLDQRDVYARTHGKLINQQLSRLERGVVERPSMRDLCLLAEVYDLTPNDMAELFGYWTPRGKSALEREDERIRHMKVVASKLPPQLREKLYNGVHVATALIEVEASTE